MEPRDVEFNLRAVPFKHGRGVPFKHGRVGTIKGSPFKHGAQGCRI